MGPCEVLSEEHGDHIPRLFEDHARASDVSATDELTLKLPGWKYAPDREFWKDLSFLVLFFFKSSAPASDVSVSLRVSYIFSGRTQV